MACSKPCSHILRYFLWDSLAAGGLGKAGHSLYHHLVTIKALKISVGSICLLLAEGMRMLWWLCDRKELDSNIVIGNYWFAYIIILCVWLSMVILVT